MEVRIKTKQEILKSFIGFIPVAMTAIIFYGFLFVGIVMWILMNFYDEESAMIIAIPVGTVLLLISIYIYLRALINSLSSYKLSINDENILIKGKAGWGGLDKVMPLSEIRRISLGNVATALEELSFLSQYRGAIKNQVASRLTFYPSEGKPFKLQFAANAFDEQSLYEFLVLIKDKGIETNVSS